jgi:hypothetical protein
MRFKITGASSESGDDVNLMLEAPSQGDVEKIAHDRGILVESITVLENGHKPKDESAIALIDEPPHAPAHTNGNGHGAHHAPAPTPAAAHAPAPAAAQAPAVAAASDPAAAGSPAGPGDGHHSSTHLEYHIMMNQSLYLLESAVNRHIKEGWEPQGGVCIGSSNNALQYFQALIRKPKA